VDTNNISTKVDTESSEESKFFNCSFDWSKSSCHVENFAIIQETLKLLEQVPCGFNVFRKLALVPAWLSRPMNRMAKGSRDAINSGLPVIPLTSRLLSFARVELEPSENLKLEPWIDEDSDWKPRDWFEDPEWIGELADSLPFRLLFKYKFKAPKHINVLESHVYGSWIKYCAKQHSQSRILGLLDSRVL